MSSIKGYKDTEKRRMAMPLKLDAGSQSKSFQNVKRTAKRARQTAYRVIFSLERTTLSGKCNGASSGSIGEHFWGALKTGDQWAAHLMQLLVKLAPGAKQAWLNYNEMEKLTPEGALRLTRGWWNLTQHTPIGRPI
jgi:hypothetical protein